MNYWLIKSEPDEFSWQQLQKDKTTDWTGVRNYAARNNLREMKKGDLAFFYHSNVGQEIVGIAKVTGEHFQDPTTDEPAWLAVKATGSHCSSLAGSGGRPESAFSTRQSPSCVQTIEPMATGLLKAAT